MFNHIDVDIDQLKRKNTENGRRYLTPSGALYPSVTTILSHKSKPYIDAWKKRIGHAAANKISTQAANRGTTIHKLVEHHLLNESTIEGEYPVDKLMKELLQGNMVGVANGRAEFGPRALGNRSLLADPRGIEVQRKYI